MYWLRGGGLGCRPSVVGVSRNGGDCAVDVGLHKQRKEVAGHNIGSCTKTIIVALRVRLAIRSCSDRPVSLQ